MENPSHQEPYKKNSMKKPCQRTLRILTYVILLTSLGIFLSPSTMAAEASGEANLVVPDLNTVQFFGMNARLLLGIGLIVCLLGLLFGLFNYLRVKHLPVHKSMKDISELIYETCKTYLITQGKFLMILWAFIGAVIIIYFGFLLHFEPFRVLIILLFSLIGIAGSYGVAWFGIRINTLANSRSAFASLRGKPLPVNQIPLRAGISVGMFLISVELFMMLAILLFIPGSYAALRIAGGIFTKIADIGSDLMKIVFRIKEDDARNPGVIADCTGDNAGDSVGPTADGFETYGVTGVALIAFIVLAINDPLVQVILLVWIFVMRILMIVTSSLSYLINDIIARARYSKVTKMNFESPLTSLVWITSFVSILLTFIASYFLIPDIGGDTSLWWKLSIIITCGTLAGAIIPEFIKVFTSTKSSHVKEVVTSAREGGPSLNILSGFVAGNFSAYWIGLSILLLMGIAYIVSTLGIGSLMIPPAIVFGPAVFAFGLVAFGFLGMGPVTIAVDSYGPVADNAQSIYELSLIEQVPNVKEEITNEFGFEPDFNHAKELLEEGDGAGNTFKASAKPVLIGTAVAGATTMIFSIIILLTNKLDPALIGNLSLLHPPFFLGLIAGGAMIYWFTGASTQAVSTGAYRAVEFIKKHIKLEGVEKASVTDSKKVVEICTQYAQKGMFNIFIAVFCATLAFAFLEPFFFVGYLIAIALFGLFQAIFMANAGGAWDNAKKVVEVDLKEKGTELHAATVIGDTVGDPFKDTSSVAMNPIIKFTTLFGLLAVELSVSMMNEFGNGSSANPATLSLFVLFLAVSLFFVFRSFYSMRIKTNDVQ
jgi:K(+)-stimulated pyrophosphate-energized sodium pump